jgi:hypothetical protein
MDKKVLYIQMDVVYHGKVFKKTRFYPKGDKAFTQSKIKTEDGTWFGLELGEKYPINVNLFFCNGRWNTNCEFCFLDSNGEWGHLFDTQIYTTNIKVKYVKPYQN